MKNRTARLLILPGRVLCLLFLMIGFHGAEAADLERGERLGLMRPESESLGVRFNLRYGGVYRVGGDDLSDAGIRLADIDVSRLGLSCAAESVPMLFHGLDDGTFDDDDYLEFVGEAPLSSLLDKHGEIGRDSETSGSQSWFMRENKSNIYFLRWGRDDSGLDDSAVQTSYSLHSASPSKDGQAKDLRFWQWRHFETNYLYTFSTLPPSEIDNFFWMEFRAGMKPESTVRTNLNLPGFDAGVGLAAELVVRVLGVTDAIGLLPTHDFTFLYDMEPIGDIAFDGVAMNTTRLAIAPDKVRSKPARFSFETPENRQNAVDSISLDWIEARYPSRYDAGQSEFWQFNNDLVLKDKADGYSTVGLYDNPAAGAWAGGSKIPAQLAIDNLPKGSTVFDPTGKRAWQLGDDQIAAVIDNNIQLTTFTAAAPGVRMQVDTIDLLTSASALPQIDPALQVLVVYHPDLDRTAAAYVKYRREQGQHVQAVSVRGVFDALNHGYISDDALKQYVKSVYEIAPGLTHLVLMGDSYFDYREARSYENEKQYKILIPIHWVYRPGVKWSGGYQDDNWYGSFANEYRPDIAVGRIPANSDTEGLDYLRKVIAYEKLKEGADDKGLLISSVEERFQSYVTQIGDKYQDRLTTVSYLFPEADKADREVANLKDAIDDGVQLLYYVGHGGSLVWRVGPVDFARQKDLFTPKDVKALTNRNHYPLVVASSCYTTAFDQPESIGEALVNKAGGGAIAVVGASWKATVQDSHEFNEKLINYYFDPAVHTLGEASLKAHREYIPDDQKQALYSSFTFLGDPCVRIVRRDEGTSKTELTATGGDTTSTVYRVVDGDIRLVDELNSEPDDKRIAEVGTKDFGDAHVYRERVLLANGKLESQSIEIPYNATSITITGRSRWADEIFPRVRINLVTEDNNRHRIYEGYWQSLSMESHTWTLPKYVKGQKVKLEIEMLNPGTVDEERTFYFLKADVTAPPDGDVLK